MAQGRQGSGIYVKRVPFTTGGISKAASTLSMSDIAKLESSLLGIPEFPDVPLNITDDEIELMVLMLNHVTVEVPNWPKRYLHVNNAINLASSLSAKQPSDISLEECVTIIHSKCTNPMSVLCQCIAHKRLDSITKEDLELGTTLGQLQHLDVRKELKDQSGAQVVIEIVNFVIRRQKLGLRCCSKGALLQISCCMYNTENNQVDLLNATPDFTIANRDTVLTVGEIESSPYVQMMVAGLGHISSIYVKYLLGICVSKDRTVNMYLIENALTPKVVGEMYVGDITVKTVSTEPYNFLTQEKFRNFLKKLTSIIEFLLTDYENRVDNFMAEFSSIPPDTMPKPTRKSERKRTPQQEEKTAKKKKNN